ncbi:50S ribosomal protein L18 [Patescibacteria group bacterium]
MNLQKKNKQQRLRRKARVNVKGTKERPRLSVSRSLKYISAQLIDDDSGKTLVFASSKELGAVKGSKTKAAEEVGKLLAEKAKNKKITKIIFDKGSYRYHGRIKALADGAREGGLKF